MRRPPARLSVVTAARLSADELEGLRRLAAARETTVSTLLRQTVSQLIVAERMVAP